jgi:hypothetical protein
MIICLSNTNKPIANVDMLCIFSEVWPELLNII